MDHFFQLCLVTVQFLSILRLALRVAGSTPQVTFPPGAGHDRYEETFNGPTTYAEPYVERYGIKGDFGGREPLHPTPPRPGYVPTLGQTPPTSTQGSVMMVYGLQPDKVNTDKLFNLFCLYGNVTKVLLNVVAFISIFLSQTPIHFQNS